MRRTPVEGNWAGSCNALPSGSPGQHTCQVLFQVVDQEFTLLITRCDAATVALSGSGVIELGPDFTGRVINDFSGTILRQFSLLNMRFTSGGPPPSGDRITRASFFHEGLPFPQFELNMMPPGVLFSGSDNGYPRHFAETGVGSFPHRCQLTSFVRAPAPAKLPTPPRWLLSGKFNEMWEDSRRYKACNESFASALRATATPCGTPVMAFLRTGAASEMASLPGACGSPCFAALNASLHDGLATCAALWLPLASTSHTGGGGGNRGRFLEQLRAVFLSRVVFLADAVAWVRMMCVSSYYGSQCASTALLMSSQVPKATCSGRLPV